MGRKRYQGKKTDAISALTEPPPGGGGGGGDGFLHRSGVGRARAAQVLREPEDPPAGGGGVGQCLRRAPWKKGGWADSRGLPRCPLARSGGGGTQKSVSTAHTGRCHQPAHEPSALFLPPPSERMPAPASCLAPGTVASCPRGPWHPSPQNARALEARWRAAGPGEPNRTRGTLLLGTLHFTVDWGLPYPGSSFTL